MKKAVTSSTSQFDEHERLAFVESSYSRYDSSSGFVFRNEKTGEIKTWFLHDDEEDRSTELFEECS